jgi:hypothetical protein
MNTLAPHALLTDTHVSTLQKVDLPLSSSTAKMQYGIAQQQLSVGQLRLLTRLRAHRRPNSVGVQALHLPLNEESWIPRKHDILGYIQLLPFLEIWD